jgi:hypothetical protein
MSGTVNGTSISAPMTGLFFGANGEAVFGTWSGTGTGGAFSGDTLVGGFAAPN